MTALKLIAITAYRQIARLCRFCGRPAPKPEYGFRKCFICRAVIQRAMDDAIAEGLR